MEGNNVMEADIILLNRLVECSRKGFKLVSISFLIVSVAMIVTVVNKEYYYDRPWDHDDVYLVAGVDFISDMHNRLNFAINGIQSPTTIHTNNNHEGEIVLASLSGENAQKVTKALEDGIMIKFNVSDDGSFVELVQEVENNIPSDKREQTLKSL